MRIQNTSFQLTRAGWTLFALGLLLAMGAFNAGLNMTYLLASLLLAVLAVASVAPIWSLRGVRCRRTIPGAPFAGEPYDIRLILEGGASRFAGRMVRITEPLAAGVKGEGASKLVFRIRASERQALSCVGRPRTRGVHRLPRLQWASGFPFGLAECARYGRDGDELLVLPARGQLHHQFAAFLKPAGARVGGPNRMGLPGQDFRSLREYVTGDNPRRIHWRASARLGKLLVREMERERSSPLLILLDSRLPKTLPHGERAAAAQALELAISFTAEVCRVALVEGNLVTLAGYWPEARVLGACTTRGAAEGYSDTQYRMFLEALARLEPSPEEDAGALIAAAGDCGFGGGKRAVVISPIPATAAALNRAMPPGSAPAYVASVPAFRDVFHLTPMADRRQA